MAALETIGGVRLPHYSDVFRRPLEAGVSLAHGVQSLPDHLANALFGSICGIYSVEDKTFNYPPGYRIARGITFPLEPVVAGLVHVMDKLGEIEDRLRHHKIIELQRDQEFYKKENAALNNLHAEWTH